jgi:hypothetical protein
VTETVQSSGSLDAHWGVQLVPLALATTVVSKTTRWKPGSQAPPALSYGRRNISEIIGSEIGLEARCCVGGWIMAGG